MFCTAFAGSKVAAWTKVSGRGGDPVWDDALRGGAGRSAARLMFRFGAVHDDWGAGVRSGEANPTKKLWHGT